MQNYSLIVRCDIYSAITFATINLYLLHTNMKVNEVKSSK